MNQELHIFRGRTELEARQMARARLGGDCRIVGTRIICDGVWNRLWGWKHFEIEAIESAESDRWNGGDGAGDGEADAGEASGALTPGNETDAGELESHRRAAPPMPSVSDVEMREALRAGLIDFERRGDPALWDSPSDWCLEPLSEAAAMPAVFREMVAAGVPESTARRLLQQVYDLDEGAELDEALAARMAVARVLERAVRTIPPWISSGSMPACMALVGPSGSGKTLTLVKLAARYAIQEQLSVAVVTSDTMRVAAAEQLRALGDLLDVPVDVVSTAREMRRAVMGRLADHAVVLIDTTGRNPRDYAAMHELRQLLNQARPDRVHLVLSAADAASHLADCASAFAAVGANSLVLTRLDECARLGHLLPLLLEAEVPLEYCSAGQNLRADLWAGDVARLMPRLLGGYVPRESDWPNVA